MTQDDQIIDHFGPPCVHKMYTCRNVSMRLKTPISSSTKLSKDHYTLVYTSYLVIQLQLCLSSLPDSGNELKSPHRRSWTEVLSGLCPGLKFWLASSKILRSSWDSIIICINFTSQYSGSQWMCAVQTSIGWWIWFISLGKPGNLNNP